jgi:two-component system LytT family response regulator
MRVLIVDDEPMACAGVAARLTRLPDMEIIGQCGDGASALRAIRDLVPDLVVLDVHMPGLDGFEVLRALPRESWPAVIFLTAYDHYAIRAFDVHAIDYLLKPIDDDRFRLAVHRAHGAAPPTRYVTRLTVRTGSHLAVVPVDEVDWITRAGDYAELHTRTRAHLVRETISALEQSLDPSAFLRIHRSRIVRSARIRELRPIDNHEYLVKLVDGSEHRSSRTYADRLERWLAAGRLPARIIGPSSAPAPPDIEPLAR